jgi:hypothetical protein
MEFFVPRQHFNILPDASCPRFGFLSSLNAKQHCVSVRSIKGRKERPRPRVPVESCLQILRHFRPAR